MKKNDPYMTWACYVRRGEKNVSFTAKARGISIVVFVLGVTEAPRLYGEGTLAWRWLGWGGGGGDENYFLQHAR